MRTPYNNGFIAKATELLKTKLVTLLLALSVVLPLSAQNFERIPEAEQNLYGEQAYVTGEYETMKNVRSYWQKESRRLGNLRGCQCALTGPGEAIFKVTVPARFIYQSNDSVLSPFAEIHLRPFLHLLKGNDPMASVIVACHSDNNGSDTYLRRFTQARAVQLAQWFRRQGALSAHIHPYGVGTMSPVTENKNLAQREKNRRVTLYFVPSKAMLKLAKKNKL